MSDQKYKKYIYAIIWAFMIFTFVEGVILRWSFHFYGF